MQITLKFLISGITITIVITPLSYPSTRQTYLSLQKVPKLQTFVLTALCLTAVLDAGVRCLLLLSDSSNIGHKMLSKMGWKEGQSLGATQAANAITTPITVRQTSLCCALC